MKKQISGQNMSGIVKSVIIGVLVAWGISLLLILISSAFISNEYIEMGSYGITVGIIQFISSLTATVTAGIAEKNKRLIAKIASGIIYPLTLLCVNFLFFGEIGSTTLLSLLWCIIGCVIGILVGNKQNKRVLKKHKRRTYR